MTTLSRGGSSNTANPILDTFLITNGVLFDPAVLEFQVRSVDGEVVYPVDGSRALVNLQDVPYGHRMSRGRYLAEWAVPSSAEVGRYTLQWFYRVLVTDAFEYTYFTPFEVIQASPALWLGQRSYGYVKGLRDEGVGAPYSDAHLYQRLALATRLFEQFTGRVFVPIYKVIRRAATHTRALSFDEPIIALDGVWREDNPTFDVDPSLDLAQLRVYNRHLEGLSDPDDREDPRIEYLQGGTFSEGYGYGFSRRPTVVRGVFGYTEPDGSPTGGVPPLVERAVYLLAVKDLPKLGDALGRDDSVNRWKLTSESTRDQSYTKFSGVDAASRSAMIGATTGDPEIDSIIHLYRRGPRFGAA
jgi:hypothetical protein